MFWFPLRFHILSNSVIIWPHVLVSDLHYQPLAVTFQSSPCFLLYPNKWRICDLPCNQFGVLRSDLKKVEFLTPLFTGTLVRQPVHVSKLKWQQWRRNETLRKPIYSCFISYAEPWTLTLFYYKIQVKSLYMYITQNVCKNAVMKSKCRKPIR